MDRILTLNRMHHVKADMKRIYVQSPEGREQ